jgi:glycosyltransferase involved in cell wall biosynthesis
MEIVWINDGSNELSTTLLERKLGEFEKTTRFIKVVYKKWDKNMGLVYCLHEGLLLCTNEIIIRMDSDDIMLDDRIIKQIDFMKATPDCVVCGTNIHFLKTINGITGISGGTNHKAILTWEDYKQNPSNWMANHPTLCFKKSAVLEVGNYNKENKLPCEDFELELKLLKQFGKLYNIQENLLYYRIHDNQVTANGECSKPEIIKFRNEFIQKMCNM